MEADCGAVWIPFHTCSNQTEVAELVSSFVMTLKGLDESISSDSDRRTAVRTKCVKFTHNMGFIQIRADLYKCSEAI